MGSKIINVKYVFRIAPGIIAILLLLQAVAGAQNNNGSSETGVTYTQDVPFSKESIAQVIANESNQPATEQGVIPFHMAPESKVLKQGMNQGTAPLKRMSAIKNELFQSLAPVLGSSFIGLTQTGSLYPPDTMGAAGPSHLMEILNDRVGFFNKSTGALISSVTLQAFWASLGIGSGQPANFPFDPKVIYDQHSGRFIAETLGSNYPPSSANSWLMIAVSNTSDPTGNWSKWAINANNNDTGLMADYPGLGVDANNVYITVNMFPDVGNFRYSKVWVVNKTQLLNGNSSITVTEFRDPTGSGFTMQPAHVFGSSSTEYFVHENYSCPDPDLPCLALNNITFPGGTPTWNRMGDIVVNNYPSTIPQAPQQGGTIETNDIRLLNAVFRDGYLWTTHHVSNISKGNNQTEVAWYQINPANASLSLPFGTPAQQGRISDASLWYYFPSIAVNSVGDVGIGFSGSSATEYAGGYYTARNSSDAPGTMQSVALLKAGLASYTLPRWGDFSATVVDPSDNTTFWTVQEYAATSTLWGTWWGRFAMRYGVNLTVSSTTLSTPAGTNATYTLFLQNNGTGTDSYTLAVDNPDNSTRANLSITSPVFVSPGETRNFTLNVTNSAAGNFSVNVTASSTSDTTKFNFINTTTTVTAVRVNLTAASTAKTTNAGVNATYTLTLQNNGTDTDSFNLTVDNPDSASIFALNVSGNISLNASENRTLTLNVTNTSSGVFRVNVTARSNNDSTKFAYINTTTTVPIVITITNPANNSVNDTGSVNVNATLDNTGLAILNWNGVNNTMTPNTAQPAGMVFSSNITRLLSGNYSFKVYANDSNGVFNVSETRIITVNRTTVTNLSVFIDPATGKVNRTVDLSVPSGNATVTIFNNTNATLNGTPITNITTDTLNQLNSAFVANLSSSDRLIGENLSLGPEGARFSPDIQIRFNYTDAELAAAGIAESNLVVKFYNTSATPNAWETLTKYSQDTSLNYTIVNVSHFSTFALVGTVASSNNNPGSSGGGGGGGGGGPSGENYSNILVKENYDLFIAKDVVTSYAFTNISNPVKFVNITGNTSAGVINVAVETLKNTSTLVKTPAPGITYKNINIWVGTTGFAVPKNIKEATIVFRVENSWLGSNNLAGSDVRLVKWDSSSWVQLETSEITRDDIYTYFEGKTNSFSPFAITGLKGKGGVQAATPAIATAQPAQTPAPTATGKAAGFEAILVIAIFIAIYVRMKRRD